MARLKRNPILAGLERRSQEMIAMQRLFSLRQGLDMAMVALNDEFGFGEERLERFRKAYNKTLQDYCDAAIENGQADPQMEYVREKLDRRLKQMCGKFFIPFEVRYDWATLEKHYTGVRNR